MKILFDNIRASVKIFLIAIFTLATLPVGFTFIFLKMSKGSALLMKVYYRFANLVSGINVIVEGEENLGTAGLYLSNHLSYLDIFAQAALKPLRFTPKSDIKHWPVLGLLTDLSNPIYIFRDDKKRASNQAQEICQTILNGDSVMLYPEGTSSDGSRVLPFKSSLFAFIEQDKNNAQINLPIIPITTSYSLYSDRPAQSQYELDLFAWYDEMALAPHIWRFFKLKKVYARIKVHPPMLSKDFKSRKELSAITHQIIANGLPQLDFLNHKLTKNIESLGDNKTI
jgi:1-acyl-sn-glycerol-3-phosphate acyltransferase